MYNSHCSHQKSTGQPSTSPRRECTSPSTPSPWVSALPDRSAGTPMTPRETDQKCAGAGAIAAIATTPTPLAYAAAGNRCPRLPRAAKGACTQPAAAGNRGPAATGGRQKGALFDRRCRESKARSSAPAAGHRRGQKGHAPCPLLEHCDQCTAPRTPPDFGQKVRRGWCSRCYSNHTNPPFLRRCRESNPDLPRDRRRYSPLYYSDLDSPASAGCSSDRGRSSARSCRSGIVLQY
jgi:hypothetical protein